ncbi:FAD:protein FMN transferase [Aliiglaciecola sp. 3_MG-2023]|uniref:FAD:protein FMN transferase n=1 Tax=Aliiglaciecola sp. 3_MG-2023 TaxID=3062644 RepID=UPI0026E3A69D|nr:FAD:protein FMN transferase [Aliiglaciecola sp. 3_MG-2023]MDO6695177.1 FAD:protein FMN transferase [Aliiglaciecola sp. 3_MG-2023]
MASPCEILVDSTDTNLAKKLTKMAYTETKRIENKYSRYQNNNLMFQINQSNNRPVAIDAETAKLLTFADTCYQISDGLFDITSGVLRKVWKFDGSDNLPKQEQVTALLPFLGWQRVKYTSESITLPVGFELDFGGIGKEYAVDCVAKTCQKIAAQVSVLVNFGGDIQVTQARKDHPYWQVGIEDPSNTSGGIAMVNIASGGLATSGDANRYLLKNGVRYGHVLNPKTGYPIQQAPRSVTVAAQQCIQSGLLATLALLQGQNAEHFLQQQNCKHWCFW